MDCPDGLARCEGGTVYASRLATIPLPCTAAAPACACPWDPVADCPAACAADGTEVVVERALASKQLCAPAPSATPFAIPLSPAADAGPADVVCDEGERYRCASGAVVDCASGRALARCVRGCFAEGTGIDDDDVGREAAFAVLCSR
jgi:hypothetical protein